MNNRVSLCLLTFNERPGCEHDVPLLPRDQFADIYCVDGGSKDGTGEYLESQGIKTHLQKKRGLNAAYVQARELCQTPYLVIFFPKGTTPPADCVVIRDALLSGKDFVIASRNIKGGKNEEDDHLIKPRKWFVGGLALIVAILWKREGHYMTDVLHGVKGFKCSAFDQMNIADVGQSIDLEMTIRGYKYRIPRTEIPTTEKPRFYGETHFKALPAGWKLLKFLAREIAGLNEKKPELGFESQKGRRA